MNRLPIVNLEELQDHFQLTDTDAGVVYQALENTDLYELLSSYIETVDYRSGPCAASLGRGLGLLPNGAAPGSASFLCPSYLFLSGHIWPVGTENACFNTVFWCFGIKAIKNSTKCQHSALMREIRYLMPYILVLIQIFLVWKPPLLVSKAVHKIQRRFIRLLLIFLRHFFDLDGLSTLQQPEQCICCIENQIPTS